MRKIELLIVFLILLNANTKAQCLDYTNLSSGSVTCTYGGFTNPYEYVGMQSDRHVVNTTSGSDAYVPSLSIIPPGGSTSVRLGDYSYGANAESITYTYLVPSADKSILIFNYAAVMENPGHSPEDQPRVKLEMLDASNSIIDNCYCFDFVASDDLGWNSYSSSLLWKDWTSIGVNLSSYVGQVIKIRITNYDCSAGGHLGYIYFDIQCMGAKIENYTCGNATTSVLQAPDGFEYAWHAQGSTNVLSRQQIFNAPIDGNTYICDVCQVGKPSCFFQLSATSEMLYPMARFNVSNSGSCIDTLNFNNTSFVSNNRSTPMNPPRECEEFYWTFGDGRTSTQKNPSSVVYKYSGTYKVTLYSSIVNGSCVDSMSQTINVKGIYDTRTVDFVCDNNEYSFYGQKYSSPGTYVGTSTSGGCTYNHELVLTTRPSYLTTTDAVTCDNEYYSFRGRNVNKAGVFYDSLKTACGCDSLFKLNLRVNKTYLFEYDTALCSKNGFMFRGKMLMQSGTYYDSLKTVNGCDSVYKLNLTLRKESSSERYVEVCEGDSFYFRGKNVTETCVFNDTINNMEGCDSIIRIIFNVLPAYYFRDTVRICEGDVYNFHGRMLTHAGTYRDSLTTVGSGCDSIYELYLDVAPKFHNIKYDTVKCMNTVYHWRDRYLTESGVYYDSIQSQSGCDSVYELRLTVSRPFIHEDYIEVCEGDSFDFRGKNVTKQGIYYDTLLTTHGCDSIYRLVFNVTRSYYFRDTVRICEGDIYDFRGRMLTKAGTYRDSLTTMVSGCDSIYELYLELAPIYHNIEYDTVCTNLSHYWRDKYLTESGVYYDSLVSKSGCDSIYELRLTVNRPFIHEDYIEVCEGDSFDFRGKNVTKQGIYYDTLLTTHGCDSIYRLVFNVTRSYYFRDTVRICEGDIYDFRGRMLTKAGTYRDSLTTTVSGCDSIYELYLELAPIYHNIEYDTVCTNLSHYWRDKYLTESGVYYDSLVSKSGCDSIYELRLTINRPFIREDYIEVCEGDSFDFRGKNVTKQGIYYDTLLTTHGCDSIYRLVFNVTRSYYFRDTVTICSGDAYDFRGRAVTYPGTYRDSLKTVNSGCDSIYELYVDVKPKFYDIKYDTVCTNGVYEWRSKYLTRSGFYYDTIKNPYGCDSIYELRLTVDTNYITTIYEQICLGNVILFNGRRISDPGVYTDTMMRSGKGCDSIVRLVVSMLPTYEKVDTVDICEGDTVLFYGQQCTMPGMYYHTSPAVRPHCDSVFKLVLRVRQPFYDVVDTTLCAGDVLMLHGKRITQSGTYYAPYKDSLGCDSVYEINVRFNQVGRDTIFANICSRQTFMMPSGKELNKTGIYHDTLKTRSGCDSIITIILNVFSSVFIDDTLEICRGQWGQAANGKWYDVPGDYLDTINRDTMHGCDTVYKTHVYYGYDRIIVPHVSLCAGQSFTYRNKMYSQTGTYYDIEYSQTPGTCDKMYIISVTVYPVQDTVINVISCEGKPYWFGGTLLTQSGMYVDTTHKTIHGCDSVVVLNLQIVDRIAVNDTVTICDGDTMLWHGKSYTKDGVYLDTLVNIQTGCNEYCTLTLSTIKETKLINANGTVNEVTICGDEPEYVLTPTFSGTYPERYSIKYDGVKIPSYNDINDVWYDGISIHVPIPENIDGTPVKPGLYTVSLQIGNGYCNQSAYAKDFDLLIEYPSSILDQHFNDVVSVFNYNYNGGYLFSGYRWFVNGHKVSDANGSNLYLTSLKPFDVVYAELLRQGETEWVPTCQIIIVDLGPYDHEYPIFIAQVGIKVNMKAKESARFRLCSMTGIVLEDGFIEKDEEVEVTLPSVAGCYMLVVDAETSGRKVFKVIVN